MEEEKYSLHEAVSGGCLKRKAPAEPRLEPLTSTMTSESMTTGSLPGS